MGEVRVDFVEVKELPFAAPLLCGTLLELVRVLGDDKLCEPSQLPVHMEVNFTGGEKFMLTTLSWGAVSDLALDNFRTPPDLPIFKRGELPPFGNFFLEEAARFALLPLTKKKEPPLAVAPSVPADPAALAQPPQPHQRPAPPRNQLTLSNALSRPVVVLMNRTPFLWLGADETVTLYLNVGDVRISARTFFGELVLPEETVTAPTTVKLGASKEQPPVVTPVSP
jgi:hypothetical protein